MFGALFVFRATSRLLPRKTELEIGGAGGGNDGGEAKQAEGRKDAH